MLVSLNGLPAVEAFEEHAQATQQPFDRDAPLPFFLHNILGIDTGAVIACACRWRCNADGSVTCAAEIPAGAARPHHEGHRRLRGGRGPAAPPRRRSKGCTAATPGAALFFDCVATRLRMGEVFGFELESVAEMLGDARLVGCNTYGQIARAEGQFGGFHNCTAVVMVLPA